jgi:hypothetical protein
LYVSLFGGIVVVDDLGPEFLVTLGEFRGSRLLSRGVGHPCGIDAVLREVDLNVIGFQFDVLVFQVRRLEEDHLLFIHLKTDRIL